MSARTPESPALSIPHCASNGTNGTCIDQIDHFFQAFSSTVVLFVLIAMLVGIIFVSLTTFHFHKGKMKKRKIQKAQEEYERDNCSPKTLKGKPALRQCVMERVGKRVQKSHPNPAVEEEPSVTPMPEIQSTKNTRHTHETHTHDQHLLESVAAS